MHVTLKKPWADFEAAKSELIALLERHKSVTFNQLPHPDAWSVNQVILHLIQVEKASLAYIQKQQMKSTSFQKVNFNTYWRYWMLRLVFALPLKFKAPTQLGILPRDLDTAQLLQEWTDIRFVLHDLLIHLTDHEVDVLLWRHPQAGKLSVRQMLVFLTRHLERHHRQIAKIV